MDEVLIDLKEIHRFYGDFEALKGISLKVEKAKYLDIWVLMVLEKQLLSN